MRRSQVITTYGPGSMVDLVDHAVLVDVMAGVEDIPGTVLAEGVPFNWESFPEYMAAVEAIPDEIDLLQVMQASIKGGCNQRLPAWTCRSFQ